MYGNRTTSAQQGEQRDYTVFPLAEYRFSAPECFISQALCGWETVQLLGQSNLRLLGLSGEQTQNLFCHAKSRNLCTAT